MTVTSKILSKFVPEKEQGKRGFPGPAGPVTGGVYPSAGIPLSTGSSWSASITDNSSDWDTVTSKAPITSPAFTGNITLTGIASNRLMLNNINGVPPYFAFRDENTGYDSIIGVTIGGDIYFSTETVTNAFKIARTGQITSLGNILLYNSSGTPPNFAFRDENTGYDGIIGQNIAGDIYISTESIANAFNILRTGFIGTNGFATPLSALCINGGLHVGGESAAGDDNLLVDGYSQHPSFNSGWQGTNWKINANGDAEFNNMMIRGGLSVYELIVNQLHYQCGGLIIGAGGGKVKDVVVSTQGDEQLRFEDPEGNTIIPFTVGAIVLVQRFDANRTTVIKKIVRELIGLNGGDPTLMLFDYTTGWGAGDDTGVFEVGDEVVAIGHTSDADLDSSLYMSAVDSGNPFLRIYDGVSTYGKWSLGDKTTIKVQIGNLTSLASYDIVSASPGYGLYTDNIFAKGKIVATSGFIGGLTGGWTINATSLSASTTAIPGAVTVSLEADGDVTCKEMYAYNSIGVYNYSQQSTPYSPTAANLPNYVCLDNASESTFNLPSSGLPGAGSSRMIFINHKYGTGLGAAKYHIQGNGYKIIDAGAEVNSIDIDEGHSVLLTWEPRGTSWYVTSKN